MITRSNSFAEKGIGPHIQSEKDARIGLSLYTKVLVVGNQTVLRLAAFKVQLTEVGIGWRSLL